MEKIYSNVTLRSIINNINMGLVDYGDSTECLNIIYSGNVEKTSYKKFVIKVLELDISGPVSMMIKNSAIKQAEVTIFTFVVFTTIIDSNTNTQMMLASSLDELIAADESFVNKMEISWNLDIPQWTLIKI